MTSGNYQCIDLASRADAAADHLRGYLDHLEEKYLFRRKWRRDNDIFSLAFCGHGRAGKDTSAEFFCAQTALIYPGSCSLLMLPLVCHAIGLAGEVAWNERHDHRKFWVEFCNAFRRNDPTRLLRMTLAKGDVSVGIRGRLELEAGLRTGVLDYAVWIDNNRVQPDFTVEYGPQDCDLVLPNHGGLLELYRKVDRLISATGANRYRQRLDTGLAKPFEDES